MPTGRDGSLFQRVFSNTSGMDPYACAVSDVYQDLFGEGSYCGKGIYDVDAFEAALAGRIPGQHGAQPRPAGGHLRPGRPGVRHRGDRRIPGPLRCGRGAPVSLGARRLAVAAVDFRLGPDRRGRPAADVDPAGRPVEDDRQPAAVAVRAGGVSGLGGGLDVAVRRCRALEPVCPGDDRHSRRDPVPDRDSAAAAGSRLAHASLRRRRGPAACRCRRSRCWWRSWRIRPG